MNFIKMSQKLCACGIYSEKFKFIARTLNSRCFVSGSYKIKGQQNVKHCSTMSSYNFSNPILTSPFRRCNSFAEYPSNNLRYSAANVHPNRCLNFCPVTVNCGQLRKQDVGTQVRIKGSITIRSINRFAQLKDSTGITQIQIPDIRSDLLRRISNIPDESLVTVIGTVQARPDNKINVKLDTGEIEIIVIEITDVLPNRKRKRNVIDGSNRANPGGRLVQNRNYSTAQKLTNPALSSESNSLDSVTKNESTDTPNGYAKKIENGTASSDEKFVSPLEDINDYTTRTHTCGELRLSDVGKQVKLYGWAEFIRLDKFILLRDSYGTTQIIVESPKSNFAVKGLHLESVICVTGTVCARPASQIAKHLATGEIEISATSVQVISKAIPKLPFHIREYNKANSDSLGRYRYLALRFPELQNNLRLRSEMLFKMREFLITKKKFVEIETPTLFKKTPGGAQEFIVPTHSKNKFYSLVQSPQQLKQLLMVGSFDRYFQIARCYRDERTNTERQPEFTQLDVELSFTTVDGVIKLTEDVLMASWPSCKPPLKGPFPRMRYQDAMVNYGSDKPCILDKFLIKDLKSCIPDSDDTNAYVLVVPNGQSLHQKLKSRFDTLVKESAIKVYVVKTPSVQKLHQNLCKIIPGFQPLIFESCCTVNEGDLVVLAKGPRKKETLEMLGLCRHHLIDELHLINEMNEKGIYDFLWIVDFPLVEQDEHGELKSTHHPFTQPHPEDVGLIPFEAVKARSLAYDLVLNGSEVGGGSIRIHNVQLQETILKLLGLPEEDFSHLLEAFKMGCPPHGGIALGIDRLTAILCNRASIKDVIAFPKATEGQDLMTGCPSDIPLADKIRYYIPATDDEREEAVDSSPYHRQSEEEI